MFNKTYTCNKCGNSSDLNYGLVQANVEGGYFSTHLNDMTRYHFSICEKCLRELFNSFNLPPKVEDLMANEGNEVSYQEDLDILENTNWSSSEDRINKSVKGLCNYNRNCNEKFIYRFLSEEGLSANCFCEKHSNNNDHLCKVLASELINFPILDDLDHPLNKEQRVFVVNLFYKTIADKLNNNKIIFKKALSMELLDFLGKNPTPETYYESLWIPRDWRGGVLHQEIPVGGEVLDFPDGILYFGEHDYSLKFRAKNYDHIYDYFDSLF